MVSSTSRARGGVRIDPPIQVWMKQLRKTPDRLHLGVRKRFREIAARVRDRARATAAGSHPVAKVPRVRNVQPQHWKNLVKSIRSGASSRSPYVAIGTKRVPWALGFEFGSLTYHQFPPWSGNRRQHNPGYFLWPTVRAEEDRIEREMLQTLRDAMQEAFPD